MRSKLVHDHATRTFVVVFDSGEEVADGLLRFAKEQSLAASRLTGIGAFSDAKLGYFDPQDKDYKPIEIDEQVEVLSLVGNVALKDGAPFVHAHVVVGKRDGTAQGGHLLEAHVRPTLEVVIDESERPVERREDEETGLFLLEP